MSPDGQGWVLAFPNFLNLSPLFSDLYRCVGLKQAEYQPYTPHCLGLPHHRTFANLIWAETFLSTGCVSVVLITRRLSISQMSVTHSEFLLCEILVPTLTISLWGSFPINFHKLFSILDTFSKLLRATYLSTFFIAHISKRSIQMWFGLIFPSLSLSLSCVLHVTVYYNLSFSGYQ